MPHVKKKGEIFVFGSNLAGLHGAGAAKDAWRKYGAAYGIGEGLVGESYAVPTKDAQLRPRHLDDIKVSVDRFLHFAHQNADKKFFVTKIGCGLAGYEEDDIAPMFIDAPDNCRLPPSW